MDNVVGTAHILDYARKLDNLERFAYFSTDEVFGPAPKGINYKENDRYNSTNPYSASKAGAEELVVAYENTYGIPSFITHTMNVFGERQNPEKFIPMVIKIGTIQIMKKQSQVLVIFSRDVAEAYYFYLTMIFLLLKLYLHIQV